MSADKQKHDDKAESQFWQFWSYNESKGRKGPIFKLYKFVW